MSNKIIKRHHLSTNKTFFKIRMNLEKAVETEKMAIH